MIMVSTQPLTEMNTGDISPGFKGGRCVEPTILPLSCADCLKIWDPQPFGNFRSCPGLYRSCFKRELHSFKYIKFHNVDPLKDVRAFIGDWTWFHAFLVLTNIRSSSQLHAAVCLLYSIWARFPPKNGRSLNHRADLEDFNRESSLSQLWLERYMRDGLAFSVV